MKMNKIKFIENLTFTNLRFSMMLHKQKLKVPGRTENLKRIYDSNLSWQKKLEWALNIINYKGIRGENIGWYSVIYNSEEMASEMMKRKGERVSGSNNPWFNHGGKYSIYSENFLYKDEEKKSIAIEKNRKGQLNGGSIRTVNYWLKRGYSEEEAKQKVSEVQGDYTLDSYKRKYGDEEGTRKFNSRQEKWQATLNSKSEEELSQINRKKIGKGYLVSKGEKLLLELISDKVPDIQQQFTLKKDSGGYYAYDIRYQNKIIEYNGDFWHMNPSLFTENCVNKRTKRLAKEQWELDKTKMRFANNKGYKTLVVWESDFNNNTEEMVSQCLNFLTT